MIHFLEFPDQQRFVHELAGQVCTLLDEKIQDQGSAGLAVSGGSTPVPLFAELSHRDLAWDRVTVTLVDERWVGPDHPDSNERLVRSHLLRNRAAAARLVPLYTGDSEARNGESGCGRALAGVPRPFAAVILGMGNDGHTASLFPGAGELGRATAMDTGRICMAITPPHAPHQRMTLTLPAILDTDQVLLHITGRAKRQVYDQALADGPPEAMPIRFVLRQQQVPVTVYWAP